MFKNKLKILSIILSYSFFIVIIIMSINAVVPEKNLIVLEQNDILVKKIDNKFLRNKNSVYEILEDNYDQLLNKVEEKIESRKEEVKVNKELTKESVKESDNFRIQFASFKEKQKSLKTSNQLKDKILKLSLGINLIVKEVKINNKEIFFRVISENKYSFNNANNECKKLKKNNIQCIIIKS